MIFKLAVQAFWPAVILATAAPLMAQSPAANQTPPAAQVPPPAPPAAAPRPATAQPSAPKEPGALLSTREALEMTQRVVDLVESTAVSVPNLARASAPVLEST